MSRVGNTPVQVPNGVKVAISGNVVTVEGAKGKLTETLHPSISAKIEGELVIFTRPSDEASVRALHGTCKALVRNMVVGVSEGYAKTLELIGVGYRGEVKGQELNLVLGYSHPVKITAPEGISFKMDGVTKVTVSGINKQVVGQVCAEIRKWRKPEPYKGKGILYIGEHIQRKQGKRTGK